MIACFDLFTNRWYRIPNIVENQNLIFEHVREVGTTSPSGDFPATNALSRMFAGLSPEIAAVQLDVTTAVVIRFEW